jgi:RNA polymerase sigma-70 factor (ECF subfamily)
MEPEPDAEQHFRALFAQAYPAVRCYGHHRGLAPADCDDLAADVFTIAWRKLGDVPADDPVPWLIAVARNVWRNGARAGRRRATLSARLPRPDVEPPPPEPDDKPGGVAAVLATLSDEDQELLRLLAWDGLTPSQIAVVLGCTQGAARVRIHRARTRLADALDVTRVAAGTETGRTAQPEEDQ